MEKTSHIISHTFCCTSPFNKSMNILKKLSFNRKGKVNRRYELVSNSIAWEIYK